MVGVQDEQHVQRAHDDGIDVVGLRRQPNVMRRKFSTSDSELSG